MIKMLINVRMKNQNGKINYTNFCDWFGVVIEPVEAFYFRHDSKKNPQYEKNMQKTIHQYADKQQKIREMISSKNLRAKFLEKLFSQYKTIKNAFRHMNTQKTGFIHYEEFLEILKGWGFVASEELLQDLFVWLDVDKDNKLTY